LYEEFPQQFNIGSKAPSHEVTRNELGPAPRNIKMDASGRLVDEKGNVIELSSNKSFKINKKTQRKSQMRPLRNIQRKAQIDHMKFKQSEFFDPELEIDSGNKRSRRKIMGLHFNEQGSHIKRAEVQRKNEISKQLEGNEEEKQPEIQQIQIQEDPKAKLMRKIGQLKPLDTVPDIEWWDAQLLFENHRKFKATNTDEQQDRESLSKPLDIEDFKVTEQDFNDKKVTHYVQHPVPLKNPLSEAVKNTLNIPLTDKQRKKLIKAKRAEKVKDRHEKVSLGLIPAPEPRLKMSSFMRAVTAQAVSDPSKVEKEVRRQMIERQKAHIEHNDGRKLTKVQKNDKFKSKMERDAKKETWSALFKIRSLKDSKNFFKVDKNAQQLYLNGFLIYTENLKETQGIFFPNMVIVEGGRVAVRKYKRLLLRRIKWDTKKEEQNDESDSDADEGFIKTKQLISSEH